MRTRASPSVSSGSLRLYLSLYFFGSDRFSFIDEIYCRAREELCIARDLQRVCSMQYRRVQLLLDECFSRQT